MRDTGRRLAAAALAAFALALGAQPAAGQEPEVVLLVDPTRTGRIDLIVFGPPRQRVELSESVNGLLQPLRSVVINDQGGVYVSRAARWRCDRRTRHFVATYTRSDGTTESITYPTRTPSCRDRLSLRAPLRARPGARVRVKVRDRWGIGDIRPTLCVRAPEGAKASCDRLSIPPGSRSVESGFRVRRDGLWRLELRGPGQLVRRLVGVGVDVGSDRLRRQLPLVLIVGDSLIQQLSVQLTDRLGDKARTDLFIRGGSGLASPDFDWIARARRQARRQKPAVTVVLLGGADPYPMTTPIGLRVECCEEGWIAEYASRVEEMMLAYGREGAGRVVWLVRPAPNTDRLAPSFAAANEAIRRAAGEVAGVRLVHFDRVFTPGFRYRRSIRRGGRLIQVFTQDGVHFTLAGSSIASLLVMRAVGPLL